MDAGITVNGVPARLEQKTMLRWRFEPGVGWIDQMATQTTDRMPVEIRLRPKPVKKGKK